MATQEERNARLDALATATQEWAAAERKRLTDQVELSKKILRGRTGSERLNNASVTTASALLVDEIDQYLDGT